MPRVSVSMLKGKSGSYREGVLKSIYAALRESLNVPEGDHFMTITEHESSNFLYGNAFDATRSDDLLYISITVFDSRNAEQKANLFKSIAKHLKNAPGVSSEDVFVNLYPVSAENWSVARGLPFNQN